MRNTDIVVVDGNVVHKIIKTINLYSFIGQQTFKHMLTQMEFTAIVDLDRPISIHGEQIAETLITRPVLSRFAFPRSF